MGLLEFANASIQLLYSNIDLGIKGVRFPSILQNHPLTTVPSFHTYKATYNFSIPHQSTSTFKMLAKVFVYATVLAAGVLGAAVPAPSNDIVSVDFTVESNPLEVCEERGIDIFGSIPSDAKPIAGGFEFEADSDASHWARAQLALSTDLHKRQFAGIGIGMFESTTCNGRGAWFDNVQYTVQHATNVDLFSVGISYRAMSNGEKLDFSKLAGTDWCGTYLYSAKANTAIGCFSSQAINCFNLHK